MSDISETARVDLFVNGEKAEATIDKLNKKISSLREQIDAAKQSGASEKELNKLRSDLKRADDSLEKMQSRVKGVGQVLNDLSNTSIAGLRNALKHLQKELAATKPSSPQWRETVYVVDMCSVLY